MRLLQKQHQLRILLFGQTWYPRMPISCSRLSKDTTRTRTNWGKGRFNSNTGRCHSRYNSLGKFEIGWETIELVALLNTMSRLFAVFADDRLWRIKTHPRNIRRFRGINIKRSRFWGKLRVRGHLSLFLITQKNVVHIVHKGRGLEHYDVVVHLNINIIQPHQKLVHSLLFLCLDTTTTSTFTLRNRSQVALFCWIMRQHQEPRDKCELIPSLIQKL